MLCVSIAGVGMAADRGSRVQCVGGTVQQLQQGPKGRIHATNDEFLVFESKQVHYLVPWDRVNLLEYGQKVSRRYVMGIVISPLLLLSKARKHFLTVGFTDEEGAQQAAVFRVEKNHIRSLLVALEARTNLVVEFQDDDARKAGKG